MQKKPSLNRRKLAEFCRKNGIVMLGVFGSFARQEATETSDLDLLVRFGVRISLLGMVRLERELSNVVGRKVDLVTEASLSPFMRESVLKDLQVIYESA